MTRTIEQDASAVRAMAFVLTASGFDLTDQATCLSFLVVTSGEVSPPYTREEVDRCFDEALALAIILRESSGRLLEK